MYIKNVKAMNHIEITIQLYFNQIKLKIKNKKYST